MLAPDFVHGPENREGEYAFIEKREPNFRKFRRRAAAADEGTPA
jgi:hypothetical protein